MKILYRNKIAPINVCPGDSVVLTWNENWPGGRKEVLATAKITGDQAMVVDEAVLIETVFEGRRAIGGLVVERISE